ncbi:hypothetical protein Pla123a_22570 [Posidoniimonas polymericola]|uniref:Iron export permease protein FetB n=1 Tax=Posidoniimonas polymericola TaxID=2528002 RepID=A0A5C5YPJ3_9BACT|nr:ABC transporter permease [Posidoniimonas polymericola]TWT76834.1 hypothetical protein Pla123a_22570 [Posidoniimonas polymericola]
MPVPLPLLAELPTISIPKLLIALAPALGVLFVLARWSLRPWASVTALARMLLQLLAIGYVLTAVFETDRPEVVGLVLTIMLLAAGGIALRTINGPSLRQRGIAIAAILFGAGVPLLLCTQVVLTLDSWFSPRYIIPLSGMALANAMNTISLAAERFQAEVDRGEPRGVARDAAMRASLIPATNALLAVGLVSIPGMMTGQVLAGVDPLIAARYQIMVMAMVFSSAGLSAACYLSIVARDNFGAAAPR